MIALKSANAYIPPMNEVGFALMSVKRIPGVRRNGQFWDEFLCEAIRKEIGSRKSMK